MTSTSPVAKAENMGTSWSKSGASSSNNGTTLTSGRPHRWHATSVTYGRPGANRFCPMAPRKHAHGLEEVAATGLPAAVVDWVLRAAGAESVAGVGVEALSGGAVSARVERLEVQAQAPGSLKSVHLVRK